MLAARAAARGLASAAGGATTAQELGHCLATAKLCKQPTPLATVAPVLASLDVQGAYEAQGLMMRHLQAFGFQVAGWKAGATAPAPQQALKLDGPFHGPLMSEDIVQVGHRDTLEVAGMRVRGVELEWAFILGQDFHLNMDPAAPLPSPASVLAAMDNVTPVIEVVASHIQQAGPGEDGGLLSVGTTTIADQGGHGMLACLPHLAVSPDHWRSAFGEAGVTIKVHAQEQAVHGTPAAVMGSPEAAAQWLVGSLQSVGSAALAYGESGGTATVPAGTILTTGTMTGITPVVHGDVITVHIGGSEVELGIATQ